MTKPKHTALIHIHEDGMLEDGKSAPLRRALGMIQCRDANPGL